MYRKKLNNNLKKNNTYIQRMCSALRCTRYIFPSIVLALKMQKNKKTIRCIRQIFKRTVKTPYTEGITQKWFFLMFPVVRIKQFSK